MNENNNIRSFSSNPSIASGSNLVRFTTGVGHLVLFTGASVTVGPPYGIAKSLLSTIDLIYYGIAQTITTYRFNTCNEEHMRKVSLLQIQGKSDEKILEELKDSIETRKALKNSVTDYEIAFTDAGHSLVAGLFTIIPFLGIPLAAAYLKGINPIEETGVHGLVEATYREILHDYRKVEERIFRNGGVFLQGIIYSERGDTDNLGKNRLKNMVSTQNAEMELADGITFFNTVKSICKDDTIESTQVKINVDRGDSNPYHELDARFVSSSKTNPMSSKIEKPVMVVFHGNAGTFRGMEDVTSYYIKLGFNVLAVTMGGYYESDQFGVTTSEISTYQDANAVISYLRKEGYKNVGVHGLSVGSTLAFAATDLHPDYIKFIVVDRPLDEAKNVAANVMVNVVKSLLGKLGNWVPTSIIRGACSGIFPKGLRVPKVKDYEGNDYFTDGLSNTNKAKRLKKINEKRKKKDEKPIVLHTIQATKDDMMGRNYDETELRYKENFAIDLNEAFYGEYDNDHVSSLEGGHDKSWDWKFAYSSLSLAKSLQETFDLPEIKE